MLKPPIPHDEEARLAALNLSGALDSGTEERFDRYTRLAARMFDVPIALISLVGRDEQVFKSQQGISASSTSRDVSFCGHAILSDSVMVVEDASKDSRFFDNPLVTGEPGIRFYAGCPLISNDGFRLGTLCIVDTRPRECDPRDIEALKDLGAMVSGELSTIRLATVDELTSLSNRRGFNMIATQSLQMCSRTNRGAALLMIDLTGFSKINERLSEACGDKVLVEFAQLLKITFRDSDVVSRLIDDKFAVLLTDSDFENAWNCVERFRNTLATRNALPGRKYRMLFNAAVVQFDPGRHPDTVRMLQEAEVLMHEQKRSKPLPKKQSPV